MEAQFVLLTHILWIAIYPLDSVICPLINLTQTDRAIYNVYGGYNHLHCKNNNNYYNNSNNNNNGLFNRSIDGSSQLNYIICHFK